MVMIIIDHDDDFDADANGYHVDKSKLKICKQTPSKLLVLFAGFCISTSTFGDIFYSLLFLNNLLRKMGGMIKMLTKWCKINTFSQHFSAPGWISQGTMIVKEGRQKCRQNLTSIGIEPPCWGDSGVRDVQNTSVVTRWTVLVINGVRTNPYKWPKIS